MALAVCCVNGALPPIRGAAQDDDADILIFFEVPDHVRDHLPHFLADGIALLRLVEDNPAQRSLFLHQHFRALCHSVLLVLRLRLPYCHANSRM
jgi:hypothetical protein